VIDGRTQDFDCNKGQWTCTAVGATAPCPLKVEDQRTHAHVTATQPRIEINPKVMLGKPVIRGTRITVELILRKLAEGATPADLMEAYPHLTVEDIRAATTYAADSVAHEDTVQRPCGQKRH
jgi:uncharacterized protein (DUF433 family)